MGLFWTVLSPIHRALFDSRRFIAGRGLASMHSFDFRSVYVKLQTLADQLQRVETELDTIMERWLELSELVE